MRCQNNAWKGKQCEVIPSWIELVAEDGTQSWMIYCQDHKIQEEARTINTKEIVKHERSIYFISIDVLRNIEVLN